MNPLLIIIRYNTNRKIQVIGIFFRARSSKFFDTWFTNSQLYSVDIAQSASPAWRTRTKFYKHEIFPIHDSWTMNLLNNAYQYRRPMMINSIRNVIIQMNPLATEIRPPNAIKHWPNFSTHWFARIKLKLYFSKSVQLWFFRWIFFKWRTVLYFFLETGKR